MKIDLAIIGGTGVYDPQMLNNIEDINVKTEYGEVTLKVGEYEGKRVAFIPRHGSGHKVPPHKINYRANISAINELGIKKIISTAAVGSLNMEMKPGELTLLTQFIDFTKSRVTTFYDGGDEGVIHTDFTAPYCPILNNLLVKSAKKNNKRLHPASTYVCTEGPRFETPAEIYMFKTLGGDLVGMTNVPEVTLARELGICYSTIAIITNYAAGISKGILTHEEVLEMMESSIAEVKELIMDAIANLSDNKDCDCGIQRVEL